MASKFTQLSPIIRKTTYLHIEENITPKQRLLHRASTMFSYLRNSEKKFTLKHLPPLKSNEKDHFDIPTPIVSKTSHGYVGIYSGCTFIGARPVNEDRVVMINTHLKPSGKLCSYFAIFDGFSGVFTCNYLRDNLHKIITSHPEIETNTGKAIIESFEEAEKGLLEQASAKHDNSGSCALVVLVINKYVYLANLGSSRCIVSSLKGFDKIIPTREHFVEDPDERQRILEAGGEIFEINGKIRVKPGNLIVSRCFGCYRAKKRCSAIVALPDIRISKITQDMDFLLLVSDGIWEVLSKHEIIKVLWTHLENTEGEVQQKVVKAIKELLKSALENKSEDNLSAIIIGFHKLIFMC